MVGVDQEVPSGGATSLTFQVLLDGKSAFESGPMKRDTPYGQFSWPPTGSSTGRLWAVFHGH
ncbi:NPCBM/NEW2 domain-containing protein [Herbiconiux solani]|uniref:NPCBM/NEW2 domain-containing protein n=1 Tax=Herbiconiux solani TaxID=661329 RepID=UPI001470AF60